DEALAAAADRLSLQFPHESLDALTQARDDAARELRTALDLFEHGFLRHVQQQCIAGRLRLHERGPIEEDHGFAEAVARSNDTRKPRTPGRRAGDQPNLAIDDDIQSRRHIALAKQDLTTL